MQQNDIAEVETEQCHHLIPFIRNVLASRSLKNSQSHSVTQANNDGGPGRVEAESGAESSSPVGRSCIALMGFARESAALAMETLPVARVGQWEGRK